MNTLPAKTRIRVKMEEGARKIIIPPTKTTALALGVFYGCTVFVTVYILSHRNRSLTAKEYFKEHPFNPFTNHWWALAVYLSVFVFLLVMVWVWERETETFHLQLSGMTYSTG
ncbi:MAG: hypothetical protein RRA15_09450 [bacterium]|nr:hypothetical protein [bacterium]